MAFARPLGATRREADESQVLFEERRFVLVWAKTAGTTSASKDAVTSSVISSVVAAYAGRPATEAEEAACDAVLAEMSADSDTAVDGAVQPYRALKYLREHSGNALYTTLVRVPASR
jgi:DNA-binding FadR family transcriptional regulator